MVVNEAPLTDVVFVVETTANFAPYQELMKSFYLNPILEYLSGRTGPTDDRDIGFDNNYNCSLYAAVWYNTAASAPELTSSCYGPAASTYKLLQLMDKMSFRGGHAESLSHVTEGIATALQCFDDLQEMRESIPSGVNNTIQKHCILFCNSPPYDLPTVESFTYNGMHLDELVAIMAKRDIKFSVISPRKMSFLFKLFEKAGGDLQSALSRKFAKDRRHMVLLSEPNGFNLQERPDSPVHAPAQPSVQPQTSTAVTQPQTPQGVKRPSSPPVSVTSTRPNSSGPAVTAGSSPSLPVQVQTQQQIRAPPPPQFNMRAGTRSPLTVRGQSPSSQQQPIQNNQQPVVQQQSPSVLTARLMTPPQPPNVQMNPTQNTGPVQRMQAPRPPTAAQIRAQQQQQQTGQFQPQPGMNRGPSPRMAAQMAQQQQQMQNQQMQPQNQMQPQSQMQSQNQMQPNQVQGMPMSQGMMNNQMLGNNNQMNQQAGQQQQMTAGRDQLQSMLMQQQPQPQVVQQQQPMQPAMVHVQQQAPQVQQQQPMQGQMRSQQRTIAWTGNIIYEEKTQGPNPQSQIKTPYSLPCQISCFTNAQTGAPEANVSGWPDTLTIQLLPRQMVMKMNTLKNESIHVGLHFQEENIIPDNKPALERLIRIMTTQSAGCVQFTLQEGPGQQPPLRIMIIIYFEEKKAFFGFIPNEQQKFFDQLKNMVQETKRQQMVQQQAQLQQQNPGVRAVMPRVPTPGQPGQVNSPQMNSPQQLQQQLQQPQQMIPQNINIRQAANAGPQFFQQNQPQGQQSGQMMPQGVQLQMNPQQQHGQLQMQQQTAVPQQNVLLNQALGPVVGPSQQQNQPPIINVTIQPVNVNTGPHSMQVSQGPTTFQIVNQGQIMSSSGPTQMTPIMSNQAITPGTQQIVAQLQAHQQHAQQLQQQGLHDDRTENTMQIKKLQEMLAAAQQKERVYQMSDQPAPQMMTTGPVGQQIHVQQQPPTQQPLVRQQLQQHIQSNQQQQRLQNLQNQQQQQVVGVTANPQLRHLLQQQQQIRGAAPNQMQQQQQHMMMQPQMRMQQQQPQPGQQQPQQQMPQHLTPQQMQALQMRQQQQQWDNSSNMDMM